MTAEDWSTHACAAVRQAPPLAVPAAGGFRVLRGTPERCCPHLYTRGLYGCCRCRTLFLGRPGGAELEEKTHGMIHPPAILPVSLAELEEPRGEEEAG